MNRGIFFLLLSFFVIACSQREIPKDVLPQKKMQAVLWDVLLADEVAEFYIQKDSAMHALEKHADLYQQVFQIHKISKEDFKRSLQFYESHPNLLKPVLDSLQKESEKTISTERPVSVS
jgi:hypothetical protein